MADGDEVLLAAAIGEAARLALPDTARVAGLRRLSGGASKESWAFDLVADDGKVTEAVLRRQPAELRFSFSGLESLADEARLLRTHRVRADTTVIPANVSYPTDSGLLAKAIGRIAATGRRIQAAGGATRPRLRDRSRSAGRRAHEIGSKLRLRAAAGNDEALAAVQRGTRELVELA